MTFFPTQPYSDAGAYLRAYAAEVASALASVASEQVDKAAAALEGAIARQATIFVCGNGGSAAIAGHFTCDHLKGVSNGTDLRPRVSSLSANIELITAIANDISYAKVFEVQLDSMASAGDVLFVISSSGSSPNILAAVEWAKAHGVTVVAMTGFSGGDARRLADISLHVDAENYGIVEDSHQALMHVLAQYLRQKRLRAPETLGKIKF